MQLTVQDDSEELQRALRVSQAVNRVRQLPTVFVANPLLAGFIALTYWDHADRTVLVGLVATMVVLWMPALLSWRRLRGRVRPRDVSRRNEVRALGFSIAAGVIWGVASCYLFPIGGPDERASLVMLMAGLTAGSVSFFSSSPVASMAFFLPFMVPLFVQAIRYDAAAQPILPSAIGVFILSALLFTKTSWRQFVETVRILVERDRALDEAKTSELQLELALSRMQDLAMVDELTGLKNRRAFFDDAEPSVAMARRRDKPVAVALLDLDHFKLVNDTHGHAAGDLVLKEVATRIVDTFREEQIVGRIGGEEFVALLPETTPAQALIAVERVRKVVGGTPVVLPDGSKVTVTLSGGIAPLEEGQSVETAMDLADKAMYRAKGLGRDRVEVFGIVDPAGTTPPPRSFT
jgi:diguanylate cyclase (GGDEF)-like protein